MQSALLARLRLCDEEAMAPSSSSVSTFEMVATADWGQGKGLDEEDFKDVGTGRLNATGAGGCLCQLHYQQIVLVWLGCTEEEWMGPWGP